LYELKDLTILEKRFFTIGYSLGSMDLETELIFDETKDDFF
jgi:hypothetical protein